MDKGGAIAPFVWPVTGNDAAAATTTATVHWDMMASTYYRLADKFIAWPTFFQKARPLQDELDELFKE